MLVANVVAQIGIVVTGGLVRLTGSGLGCPTWPECVPGSYTPVVEQAEGLHKWIEFGNRTLTGVVGLTALLALVAVWRLRRPRLRLLAAAPLLLVAAQAVIGGITVLTSLHPVTVATHFLVSMLLVAVSVLLVLRVREGDGPALPVVPAAVRRLAWALAAVAAVVLVLGTVVTGSGPHSGDADEPARFALDPRTVSWLHADAVLLFVGLLVGLLVALPLVGAPAVARRRARWVLVVTLLQGLVGYVQYATGLPEALVLAHMLGAALLTVAVTGLLVALRERPHRSAPTTVLEPDVATSGPRPAR
ncbi:COX15/CtaA family protein [Thalassiella azotivora]